MFRWFRKLCAVNIFLLFVFFCFWMRATFAHRFIQMRLLKLLSCNICKKYNNIAVFWTCGNIFLKPSRFWVQLLSLNSAIPFTSLQLIYKKTELKYTFLPDGINSRIHHLPCWGALDFTLSKWCNSWTASLIESNNGGPILRKVWRRHRLP